MSVMLNSHRDRLLLQSFQALMLHFQSASDMLPPGTAKKALEEALDHADQAILEGRNAIQNLRSAPAVTNDFAQAIAALGEELGGQDATSNSARFGLSVEVRTPAELRERVDVVKRRDEFERDRAAFVETWRAADDKLRRRIVAARKRLVDVRPEDTILERAAALCMQLGTDGLRAELTMIRAELGCKTTGQASFATARTNGVSVPP